MALAPCALLLASALPAQVESEDLVTPPPSQTEEAPPPEQTDTPPEAPADPRFELEQAAEQQYLVGNLDEAAALYEQLGRLLDDPDLKMQYWTMSAWLRSELGDTLQASALLQEGLRIAPDYELPAERFPQSFVEIYRTAEALVGRERLEEVTALVQRGVAAMSAGRSDEARELLDQALTIDPENTVALYNRGLIDLQQGKNQEAIDILERLATLDIRDDSVLANPLRARVEASLGLLYLRREFFEDARRHLETAVALDPSETSAWTNLGLTYRGLGEEGRALEAFEEAYRRAPEDPQTANNLASSHLRRGDAARAAEVAREATRRHPDDSGAWLNLGLAEQETGNLSAARDAFLRVLEIDPTSGGGRVATYLATVEYGRGEYAAAAEAARKALETDPGAVEAWLYLGLAEQKEDRIVEAQQAFRKAVELDPERPESQNNLGTVLVSLGDYEGAAAAFRKALEARPDFAAAQTNLQQVEAALAARQASADQAKSRRRTKEIGIRFDNTDFSYLGLEGAVVDYVKPRSPAAKGGMMANDIVLGVDGHKIAGPTDFLKYVYEEAPGDTIQVDILRDNRPRRLLIEIR